MRAAFIPRVGDIQFLFFQSVLFKGLFVLSTSVF